MRHESHDDGPPLVDPWARALAAFLESGDVVPNGLARLAMPCLRVAMREALRQHAQTPHAPTIRRFFLDPEETYTVAQLAELWRVALDDVRAVYHDDLESWKEAHPDAIDALPVHWMDAAGATAKFNMLRTVDVENALGSEFDRVRLASWRAVPLMIALPQWLVAAIETDVAMTSLAPSNATVPMRIERALLDLLAEEHERVAFRGSAASNQV